MVLDDLSTSHAEQREKRGGSVIPANMVNPLSYFKFSREKEKATRKILIKILPIMAFIPPFLILYSLYPASFEATWEGRTFYLFFVWLISLELILNWEKVQESKINKAARARTTAFIVALLLPTLYVIATNYFGINTAIVNWATRYNVDPNVSGFIPLSTEYLVLTVLFASIISLGFGVDRLKDFALSTLFLGAIGSIYTINNFYPYGRFTPFQIPVPITTQLAASFLNLMGYHTSISQTSNSYYGWLSNLTVMDPKKPLNTAGFSIAWPCAGVESLIIYTITILIFLKGSAISWRRRTIYFAVGAIVTYFINILRIATIFIIQINTGGGNILTPQAQEFHDYYGQLYSITWIVLYPLVIMGSQLLWNKFKIGTAQRRSLQGIGDLAPVTT